MINFLKFCMVVVVCIACCTAGYTAFFYYQHIRPYQPIINDILANADAQHKHLPDDVRALIKADVSCNQKAIIEWGCDVNDNINYHIVRLLPPPPQGMRTLKWHAFNFLLAKIVISPLDDDEKYTLIAERSFFIPNTLGYNSFSQHYFHKKIDALTLDESAELVAITKAPTMFLRNAERREMRKNYLLSVVEKDRVHK